MYGFIKVGCSSPEIRVADCDGNAMRIVECVHEADRKGAHVLCLPELCVTGYTCADLFLQPTLLKGALRALEHICEQTKDCEVLFAVGLPFFRGGKIYNCAAVVKGGRVLGIVPKTYLPNYNEFYEQRWFVSAEDEDVCLVDVNGAAVPFGTDLIFACHEMPQLRLAVEICEDLWSPLSPSTAHALSGATMILNLSASNETVGKADYRRRLVCSQSARLICAYAYADAGRGESTTDLVFASHHLIAENGVLCAESELFANASILCEVDMEKLVLERMKNSSFATQDSERDGYETVWYSQKQTEKPLLRAISRTPFIPAGGRELDERCEAILQMQAEGLRKRIEHTRAKKAVVGISGGLDSCLALLVATRAMARLSRPMSDIVAVTMPCFGTTKRTRSNAQTLCEALGVSFETVDITETVNSNFRDVGQDPEDHDVTFENTQARVRTLVLMNLANRLGGLVVGTGDLSELALGWATYNGDHMSMYGVNASVPKTLVRHLVDYASRTASSDILRDVLRDILDTPVSPELLPAKDGEIVQQTEQIVGPYELHDFFLFYAIRYGFAPKKIYWMAQHAFDGAYPDAELYRWLRNFYWRFFAQQFKRSCIPDGPKVGSVSLSPRGDWRMPSDAVPALWLSELDEIEKEIGHDSHAVS